jgi:hypothetical protein
MATTQAIAATTNGIVRLLELAYEESEFGNLEAKFESYQAPQFQKPMKFGLSLFLYRVTVNTSARNSRPHPRPSGDAVLPPLPVDLFCLLTAWAENAPDQQELLGWAMRVLQDTPILPPTLLNIGFPGTFGPAEAVELGADQLAHQDMAPLWEIMKPNQQPSVGYVARMVALESDVVVSEHPAVQTRIFEARKPVVPV